MENQIILQGTTPEALAELINQRVKIYFDDFKKNIGVLKQDELLTREQACSLLQVDPSTLWAWTKKGKVTSYGIGNRVYYKKAELLLALKPLNK